MRNKDTILLENAYEEILLKETVRGEEPDSHDLKGMGPDYDEEQLLNSEPEDNPYKELENLVCKRIKEILISLEDRMIALDKTRGDGNSLFSNTVLGDKNLELEIQKWLSYNPQGYHYEHNGSIKTLKYDTDILFHILKEVFPFYNNQKDFNKEENY